MSKRRRRSRAAERWRRHKFLLIVAVLPLLVGGVVTAAIAAPPAPGPVHPVATPNPNCTLTVPADPLSARGLATPYVLSATTPVAGPCHEANPAQSAFVQATIYDPATGALAVYDPLVVDAGRRPAVEPLVPELPADAVVGIWFGYNGTNLTLRSAGHCVNGLGDSVFSQFAYCNADRFFDAVNAGIARHRLTVPALGTGRDGKPCPTTRDFSIVDQDQSDNVTTRYLLTRTGRTAQNTPANAARLHGAKVLANPSDNALVDEFVDPALGCTPWTARNLDGGGKATSLALDEIKANADQAAPVALVPLNDPMTLVNGRFSATKTNLYRVGVDQPPLDAGQGPRHYCQDLGTIQSARLRLDLKRFSHAASPDPAAASTLLTFLANRLNGSFQNLGCAHFGLTDPVSSETVDDAGAVAAVTFAS
ncbi:MAG TPA: hypothetical protein VFN97_19825 [Actinospica sp.]|nr:hypothetical protein [Actinospica sp.]